jgi:AcrR family transcriptional regulator
MSVVKRRPRATPRRTRAEPRRRRRSDTGAGAARTGAPEPRLGDTGGVLPGRSEAHLPATRGTSKRPRGRPAIPSEVQRRRLVEAARQALRDGDFGSVRVADVVRRAGMSSRSFYDHFASKEDLLLELIHDAGRALVSDFEAIFATVSDPEERVDQALAAYLGAFAGTPLDLERLGESASGRVQRLLRHYVQEVGVRIQADVARLVREGVIRRMPEPVTFEVVLLGLLGVASRYVADGRMEELTALRPALRRLVMRVWA